MLHTRSRYPQFDVLRDNAPLALMGVEDFVAVFAHGEAIFHDESKFRELRPRLNVVSVKGMLLGTGTSTLSAFVAVPKKNRVPPFSVPGVLEPTHRKVPGRF